MKTLHTNQNKDKNRILYIRNLTLSVYKNQLAIWCQTINIVPAF
jgi:hypothetical protein